MSAPSIAPVGGDDQPIWSVMIPAHESERFLGATIDSVLASELPQHSQIEVVDDMSEDGTRQVADEYRNNGVTYYRHEERLGASANFNACIERARGRLVHILHSDDEIVPGFYDAMHRAFSDEDVVAAFCRADYIDDAGNVRLTTRPEGVTGRWINAIATLAISNRIRPPAIAVRRSAYEDVGGFREDLHHAADWEMWMRLARHGALWFENRALARYRVHDEQDTMARVRSGENIRERVRALELVNRGLPKSYVRKGLLYSAAYAGRIAFGLIKQGEWSAARAQLMAGARCGAAGLVGEPAIAQDA